MSDTTAVAGPSPDRRPRHRGFLWPLLLIALGGAFLAANLGYLPPLSARALFQLWPLLLILPGIEILLARRQPLLALVLEVLVVAVAIGAVVTQPRGLLLPIASSASSATVPRQDATALSLRVEGGAGTYTLSGGATDLVEARSDGGEITVRDVRSAGGRTAEVRVQPTTVGDIVVLGATPPVNVDVRVARDVPTSLRVQGGAGDFLLDLRDVQVREARIESGASRVEVTLPRPSGDVPIRIQAGAASIVIVVPPDVEARIATTGALLTMATENTRFGAATGSSLARSGSATETAGYANAKDRVTITIEAGASSIIIR